jgi:NAD(P)-dependent dehydrogenase (short-subunit alcohol dehydrogenase family)
MSFLGIGAATVRRLIKEGAHVVIADISAEAGTALAAELGPHAAFVSCDVRRECWHALDVTSCKTEAKQKAPGWSNQSYEGTSSQQQRDAGRRRTLNQQSRSRRSDSGRCI